MKKNLLFLSLFSFTLPIYANDFEASLSSQTAQFSLYSDSSVIGWGGSDLALRFMYNEADDILAQAEILSLRQASKRTPLTLGVGVKAYLGQLDIVNKDILAVGVGGAVRYVFPGVMPVTAFATIFAAPQITSFSGSKEIKDFHFGVQIEAMPQTSMFVGYRRLEIDTSKVKDYRFDDDRIQFGIRLTF